MAMALARDLALALALARDLAMALALAMAMVMVMALGMAPAMAMALANMTTYEGIHRLPPSAQARISSGEFSMHYVHDTQCITIPFQYYLMLEENKLIAKQRKRK